MTNTNQTNTIKIDPKCIGENQTPAYSATGYILPCCYADNHNIEDFKELTQEHLSVENVKDVMDIFDSVEWANFHKMLIEDPESAPRSCKYYCKSRWTTTNRKYYAV